MAPPGILLHQYKRKHEAATAIWRATTDPSAGMEAWIAHVCLETGKPPSLQAIADWWHMMTDATISEATASRLKARHAFNPRTPSPAQEARRIVR